MISDTFLKEASQEYDGNSVTLRKNLKFAGHTLEEWSIELAIKFPDDIDYSEIERLSKELDEAFMLAHNNYIVAQGVVDFLKRTLDTEMNSAFTELGIGGTGTRLTISDKERMVS